jgi:hypothetical protein
MATIPPARANGFASDNAQDIIRLKLSRPITVKNNAAIIESQPITSITNGYMESPDIDIRITQELILQL